MPSPQFWNLHKLEFFCDCTSCFVSNVHKRGHLFDWHYTLQVFEMCQVFTLYYHPPKQGARKYVQWFVLTSFGTRGLGSRGAILFSGNLTMNKNNKKPVLWGMENSFFLILQGGHQTYSVDLKTIGRQDYWDLEAQKYSSLETLNPRSVSLTDLCRPHVPVTVFHPDLNS